MGKQRPLVGRMKQEVIEITVSTHGKPGAKDALCHRAVFGLFAWAAADPALARLFLARLVAPVCLHFIAGLQLHLAHIYWTLSPVQRFPHAVTEVYCVWASAGKLLSWTAGRLRGFILLLFLFKVLESSQMDSARQTVLSVHQRIVDNGGMMLIIFPHVCYAFIAFSFCIPVSRVVVGQIFSVKGNLVLVCWMSGKLQMCSRARLHNDCSVVFATWLSEWVWHFLSCYCLVTIIFVIGIEEQQASKLTHQECLWRKLVA